MEAGLKPKFTAGLNILGIGLDVGPFLSLPYFVLNTTQLSSSEFGANCETNGDTVQEFKDSFTNLTHVGYSAGIGGGLDIDLGFFGDWPITFAFYEFPLATQCLVYHTGGSTIGLAEATSVLADITKPPEPIPTATGQDAADHSNRAASIYSPPTYFSLVIILSFLFFSTGY
jgi:hypothetical protein